MITNHRGYYMQTYISAIPMILFAVQVAFGYDEGDIQEVPMANQDTAAAVGAPPPAPVAEPPASNNTEVIEFSPASGTYYLKQPANPAPVHEPTPVADESLSDDAEPYNRNYIPPAPTRPIGKTVAGIVLSGQGAAVLILSIVLTATLSSAGADSEYMAMTLPYWGLGLGLFLPGIGFAGSAKQDWNTYNAWQAKYQRESTGPRVNINYTFNF
jgi:hypothetical protein